MADVTPEMLAAGWRELKRAGMPPLGPGPGLAEAYAAMKTIDPEIARLDEIIAEAYQVLGVLAEHAGLFEHPEVQRAMDYLANNDMRSAYLTPWPRTPLTTPAAP